MDAIEKARSGHPGLPLGAAEIGALLYGEALKHNPADPHWPDRDRFVLSGGHGSMLLYSLLHLSGYAGITLDAIKTFRQAGSPCAGHPEYGLAGGIEMTTGPLGQGLATAVGMAIAETMLAARFNTPGRTIVDHRTWVLAGDGCFEEGVTSEASSLAGTLGLGKLTVFYDYNRITIDGGTALSFTEDTARRYEAYGWQVLRGSMYDFEEMAALIDAARKETAKPSLIILESVIGKGAPHKQNTAGAHGAPLGADEVAAARAALGIPGDFYVDPAASAYFGERRTLWAKDYEAWKKEFAAWSAENPQKRAEWDAFHEGKAALPEIPATAAAEATRAASGRALQAIAAVNGSLVGGSADLTGPNSTALPGAGVYNRENRAGRYIHYGIREFAMAAISNGIALHGGLRPFCATFMVFSDYLRPALRLSALMKLPVIYIFTHDSIFVGEDGATHQPVEHLAGLRAMPGLLTLRPADAEETAEAWKIAMERSDGPTALILSRQNLPVFQKADSGWRKTIRTGAYIAKEGSGRPDAVIIATGSELSMALKAADSLPGKKIRVVSMPSRELFASQPAAAREKVIPPGANVFVAEAGLRLGWEAFAPADRILSIDGFGLSAPGDKVAEILGFTAEALGRMIAKALG
jgi:transketolase